MVFVAFFLPLFSGSDGSPNPSCLNSLVGHIDLLSDFRCQSRVIRVSRKCFPSFVVDDTHRGCQDSIAAYSIRDVAQSSQLTRPVMCGVAKEVWPSAVAGVVNAEVLRLVAAAVVLLAFEVSVGVG